MGSRAFAGRPPIRPHQLGEASLRIEYPTECITDDLLEDYTFNRLQGRESARLGEHLLICAVCRASLTDIEDYIAAITAVLVSSGSTVFFKKLIEC
jgi:hypothetical protein